MRRLAAAAAAASRKFAHEPRPPPRRADHAAAAAAGAHAEREFERTTAGWALTSGAATPTAEAGRHVDVVTSKTIAGARTRAVGDGPRPAAVVGRTPARFVVARPSSAVGAIADGRGTYLRHSVLLI